MADGPRQRSREKWRRLSDEIAVVEIRKTRRCVMAKRRGSVIERVLKRIEDRVEEYRAQERVREVDLQAHRAEL